MFATNTRRTVIIASTFVALIGSAASASAGEATFGWVNPRTGAFRAANTPVAPAATVLAGTVNFTINVTISSGVPAGHVPVCTFRLNDYGTNFEYFEDLTVKAVRTGAKAVCKGALKYYWPGVAGGTQANYSVRVDSNTVPDASGVVSFMRSSTKDMGATVTLPANNGTVSVTDKITY